MTLLASDLVQFLIRGAATAAIVAFVLISVNRFGPTFGGYLTGVPIIIGPGIAFIAIDQEPLTVLEVSRAALAALYGTQAFLVSFVFSTRRGLPAPVSLFLALTMWLVAVVVLVPLRLPLPILMAGFVLLTLASRAWMGKFLSNHLLPRHLNVKEALLRGLIGGAIVATACLTGHLLRPEVGGIIVALPVALLMITTSVRSRYGFEMLANLAHAALLGVGGLAIFAFVVAQTIQHTSAVASLTIALLACLAFTAGIAVSARKPRPSRS